MEKRKLPALLLTLLLAASMIATAGTSVKASEAEPAGMGTEQEETEAGEPETGESETGEPEMEESEIKESETGEPAAREFETGIEETGAVRTSVVDQPIVEFVPMNKVGEARPLTDEDSQAVMEALGSEWVTDGDDSEVVPLNAKFKVDWNASTLQMDDIWGSDVVAYDFSRDESGKLVVEREIQGSMRRVKVSGGSSYVTGSDSFCGWNFFKPGESGYVYQEEYAFESLGYGMTLTPDLIQIRAWYNPSDFDEYGYWGRGFWTAKWFVVDKEDSIFHFKDKEEPEPPVTAEDYVLDISKGSQVLSKEIFSQLLQENQTKNVIIKTNDDVTFTFKAGTMKAVEGKESYDFSVLIHRDYKTVTGVPRYVTNDQFVLKIDYNYSGKLPAEAAIRIYAGKNYAGRTLYYGQLLNGTSISLVQPVTVDGNGYITVRQDHCSSYILTSTEPKAEENGGNGSQTQQTGSTSSQARSAAPATGDNAVFWLYCILAVMSIAVLYTVKYRVIKK